MVETPQEVQMKKTIEARARELQLAADATTEAIAKAVEHLVGLTPVETAKVRLERAKKRRRGKR